jgi:pimeloyl-ACP methyl ester carboxylesterase
MLRTTSRRYPLLTRWTDKILLHPSTDSLPIDGLARRLLSYPGGEAEVWVSSCPDAGTPNLFVLQFTGNGTRAEEMVGRFLPCWAGWQAVVWTVNYPGFGGSTGPARLAVIPELALTAYDEMARAAAGTRILVLGDSLGTTAALYVAARRDVAGVVVRNPPPLRQLIVRRHGWWNLWLPAWLIARRVPPELDAITNASRATAPAVFLRSECDTLVPPRYQQLVYGAYAGPKRLVLLPGAGHNSPMEDAQAREVGRLVDQLLKRGAFAA